MTTPDDELAERGRAIFERLRASPPESDADHAEEAVDETPPTAIESETSETIEPSPDAVDVAVLDAGGGVPDDEAPDEPHEDEPPSPAEQSDIELAESPGPPVQVSSELEQAGWHDPEGADPAQNLPADEVRAAPVDVVLTETGAEAQETGDEDAVPVPPPVEAEAAGGFARPLPRILAIANQKGGVGKTTTAVNLGAALAELGYRVLVVDLDPQGNATTGLGINPRNLENSVYDVLMHDASIEDCIEPTSLRNLFVVPSTIDLAGAEIELVPTFSRELKLRRALETVHDDFDFCLIDCPPSLGLITVNGLAAATEVVVPIQCEYYALEGLGQLLRNVSMVQGNLNPGLEVSAIILTMYDARTKLADQVANEVRAHFGPKVCRNIVPRTVRLSEAPSFGQPIIVFDPSSRGAIAYRELAKEVSGGAPQRVG